MELGAFSSQEQFSELYVLGPEHSVGNYPFNVSVGTSYTVYLDVINHMDSSMYFVAEAKIRNASERLPNDTLPSSLPVLYQYKIFLGNGRVWEGSLTFSLNFSVPASENSCFLEKVKINGINLEVDKTTIWDNSSSGFYYQLIVELWEYNLNSQELLYSGRFVTLWLNMTST